MQVSRKHVADVLAKVGASAEAKQHLLDLDYPMEFDALLARCERLGIDREVLIDRMGGSP